MTSERWRKFEELYHAARQRDPSERSAFLADECRGDDELKRNIESLLAQDSVENVLNRPAAQFAISTTPAPDSHAKSLSPGDKLGPYAIVALIGSGGMGEVYKAQDSRLRRNVALKVLLAEVSNDRARRQRFEREAHVVAALNHPNIVSIHDVGDDKGVFFIVTELVEGEPLRTARCSVRKALDIAVQIASGLAAAHQAGVVHRDLKPANILLDREGRVKILDFGLAKYVPSSTDGMPSVPDTATMETHSGVIMGTPGYMSPEQVKGLPADHRSDIFSFGVILYELLAGDRAFHGASAESMAAILHTDPPELPESVPSGVRNIVKHCLEKDPAKRFQSARDLSFALGAPGNAPLIPAGPRSLSRIAWGATGVMVLIAVAFAAGHSWRMAARTLTATVLTSYVGRHEDASLSPDGNQFAFAWDADIPNGKQHVYISLVGKGTPVRLTPENEIGSGPAWSPDGQSIAYWHTTEQRVRELIVMPALGGPGRKIASATTVSVSSWSPDGKWLLWGQQVPGSIRSAIHAAPAGGGEPHELIAPPEFGKKGLGEWWSAVSPNGRELVWEHMAGDLDTDLYLSGSQDGSLTGTTRQLTHDHKIKGTPRWTNDGKEIIYVAGGAAEERSLYRVSASGGEPQRIEGIGANVTSLTLAAKSNRLLYSTRSTNFDIRRVDLRAPDAGHERFLASTRVEVNPSYSPDGTRIAFSSNRGGNEQIWVADADGSNPSPLTSFPEGRAGCPKWSPDGQSIVFDARPAGNADIYTSPAGGGAVRRLTDNAAEDLFPFWSADGKWIYFASSRAGGREIFRMRPDGSTVQQMTHDGGLYGMVSADGKWLYYSLADKGLRKIPADGGQASQVLAPATLAQAFSFVTTVRGIYAVGAVEGKKYPAVLYPFAVGKPHTVAAISLPPIMTPAVSPDGRWLLYTAADDPTYEIMVVENFH